MGRVAALFLMLALSGCKDYGRCLKDHEETITWSQPVPVGSTSCGKNCSMPIYIYIPQTMKTTACDQWEFPEGRDK